MPLVEQYGKLEEAKSKLETQLPDKLKESILQEAVWGKLVPQLDHEEPASDLLDRVRSERAELVKQKKIKAPKGGDSVIYRGDDGSWYERVGKSDPVCIDEEIPFDIPESWEWARFSEIARLKIGKTPQRGNQTYWNNGDIPWFSISDMKDGKVISDHKESVTRTALDKCFKNELSPAGTLIMSFKLTIGKTSILGVDAVHNEAIISITPFADEGFATRDYLLHVLPLFAAGGDTKSAIKGATLNSTSLAALLIPLPPLAEQQRIVEKIDELMPLVERLK